MNFNELDAHTTLRDQFNVDVAPLVIVNRFVVPVEDEAAFVAAWQEDKAWFADQPGFIAALLVKGVADSRTFVNFAEWKSSAHFRNAVSKPEVKARYANYPSSVSESLHMCVDC